ncbi:MAG: hypothetical protein G3H99_03490 [Ferrovum sp.]|nr:hypothetical protein [Ferrovum sp.]NDU88131.1 hypothetical protein [Ferrovum sp.]
MSEQDELDQTLTPGFSKEQRAKFEELWAKHKERLKIFVKCEELTGCLVGIPYERRKYFLESLEKRDAVIMRAVYAYEILHPSPEAVDYAGLREKVHLREAKWWGDRERKIQEIKARNMSKDELIRDLAFMEVGFHEANSIVDQLVHDVLPNAVKELEKVLNSDISITPQIDANGVMVRDHVEQQKAVMNQIIEVAKPFMEKLQDIKDGYKQRPDHQARLDVVAIVQRIHEGHQTKQGIIDALDLVSYRKKYKDATLRKWINEAIPHRKFRPGAPKKTK